MKKYICILGLLLFSTSLFAQKESNEWTEEYIKHNIAFTNITARVISSDLYVCEIRVTDYSKSLPMPDGFGLNKVTFSDNGEGNDLVKGDGVYSSMDPIKFLNGKPDVLTKGYNIFDENYKGKFQTGVSTEGFGCKIRKCGCPCPTYTCRACEWWGWSCMELYDCEIIFF